MQFSKNPITAGETVTLRALVFVASSTIPATGTVTFLLNGLPLASGVALSGGLATHSVSTLPAGTHTIGASYAGSGVTYLASSGSASLTINKAGTTVALTSSANPSVVGQPVTVTATVTATAPGTGTPTGSVSLSGSGLPAATLVAGKATFTYTGSSPGTASLQAVYAGDSRFNGSSSASVSQVVGKAATTATVTTSANPSTYFDGTTATVTVAPVAPGAGTPTGTVRLIPGNGTVTLSGGKATWLLRDTTPGSVTLSAVYNGDANFATSTSAGTAQTVQKAVVAADVSISPSGTVAFGTPVTVTVPLGTGAPVQRVPSGTVTVAQLDANGSGTKTLSAGKAVFTTTAGANGSGSYAVTYSGDAFYLPLTLPVAKITVKKGISATLVSASGLPVQEGGTFTLLAEVAGPDVDRGTATITDGGTVVATGVPVNGNLMSRAVKAGSAGKHTYRVAFSGTANVEGSSGTLDVVIQPRPASETGAGSGTPGSKPAAASSASTTSATPKPQEPGAARPGTTTGATRPGAQPGATGTAKPKAGGTTKKPPATGTTPAAKKPPAKSPSGKTTPASGAGAKKPPAKKAPTKKQPAKAGTTTTR